MKKRIIIFGSSVAYGEGAYCEFGWAAMLAKAIDDDCEIINKSVCGNRTKHLLKRVHKDVIQLKPDMVIVAVSLGNEGLLFSFKQNRCNRFLKNMKKLLAIFNENNIKAVITNVYPHEHYKQKEYYYVQKMNLALDELDVPVVNVCGCIDNLKGNWLDNMYYNSAHPNDQGHLEMMSAFQLDMFKNMGDQAHAFKIEMAPKGKVDILGTDFRANIDGNIRSFTLSVFVKPEWDSNIITIGDFADISIINNKIEVYSPKKCDYVTSEYIMDCGYVFLSYHPYLKRVSIYVDGNQVAIIDNVVLSPEDIVLKGSGVMFENVALYRGRLSDMTMKSISSGKLYNSSLEIFSKTEDYKDGIFYNNANNESCFGKIIM